MSAYMVGDEVINKIVNWLGCVAIGRDNHSCADIEGYDLTLKVERQRLADDMFALNVKAVNFWYGEGTAERFRPLDFEYVPKAPENQFTVMKALETWRYQCAEGDIPEESALYKAMGESLMAMYQRVVWGLPEYESAPE